MKKEAAKATTEAAPKLEPAKTVYVATRTFTHVVQNSPFVSKEMTKGLPMPEDMTEKAKKVYLENGWIEEAKSNA